MSHNQPAVQIRGLSKAYTIRHNQRHHSTLAEAALHRLRRPFRRAQRETFWALKDIDLEIQQGDVVGIIGRNGAGKSTLLKVLSRITDPTQGQIDLFGRVGSLLEVGTGFHPELTGRENVYLNGTILGMKKPEIDAQFDAIVDFAGVEQFLDTPVKRYSSGMKVRLAFAVAAHLRTEILIVDEVLAVGDVEFQKKCIGKMQDVATGEGRTVLFVSHRMQSVKALCSRAMYLEHGQCAYLGNVPDAIQHYLHSFDRPSTEAAPPERRSGTGELRFTQVQPDKTLYTCGEEKRIHFRIEKKKPFAGKYFLSALVTDPNGNTLLHCDSRMADHWINVENQYEGTFVLRNPWLKPGEYRVDLSICSAGVLDRFDQACILNIGPILPYEVAGNDEATKEGMVFADFDYREADGPKDAEPAAVHESALLGAELR